MRPDELSPDADDPFDDADAQATGPSRRSLGVRVLAIVVVVALIAATVGALIFSFPWVGIPL